MTLRDRLLKKLDELLALEAKATPGPWIVDWDDDEAEQRRCWGINTAAPRELWRGDSGYEPAIVVADAGVYPPRGADASLIAESRTYGPAAWRALRAEVSEHGDGGSCWHCRKTGGPCPTLRRIASEILGE